MQGAEKTGYRRAGGNYHGAELLLKNCYCLEGETLWSMQHEGVGVDKGRGLHSKTISSGLLISSFPFILKGH